MLGFYADSETPDDTSTICITYILDIYQRKHHAISILRLDDFIYFLQLILILSVLIQFKITAGTQIFANFPYKIYRRNLIGCFSLAPIDLVPVLKSIRTV